VLRALKGCDLIVHAGDIGGVEVLEELRTLAPLQAVRGNNDRDAWALTIPLTAVVEVSSKQLYLLHDLAELDLDPAAAGFAAVISGHSHRPGAEMRNGVLFLNPGSAGPRRFALPISVAEILVREDGLEHRILELEC
jgi:putative phosphoesterase